VIKRSIVAAALAASSLLVHAQSKEELARRVVELQRPVLENVARTTAALPASQLMQAAAQSVRRAPAEQREALAKQIEADVRKFHGEVEALLLAKAVALAPATLQPLLQERFTEAELKELITWLESPVARKFQEATPVLVVALSRKLVNETRTEVEGKVKALQDTVNKRLAAAMPPRPASGASK
jgi:hypothetical protein